MTPQRGAIGTAVVALGVTAIVIVAVAGVLVITSQSGASSTGTSTSRTFSTTCEVPVEGAGVFLHIVSDSTQQPLPEISVHAVPTASSCFGASGPGPSIYITNATGWVSMNVSSLQANYYFNTSLAYEGRNYNFILPQGPLDTTNATLHLPSGNLSISLCYTMATSNPCRLYNASSTTNTSSQSTFTITTTSTSSSCSGYPPGGNCIAPYSYTFTLSVNYSGPWKLAYQGYNSLDKSNPTNVSGSYQGTGFYSKAITLSGLNNNGLTLCAQAQKLDASNRTLILTITGYNETLAPYGTVSYCGGVVP